MHTIRTVLKKTLLLLFRIAPLKRNLVVFDNFNGKGYSCNPKYIAEALKDQELELAWLDRGDSSKYPPYIKPIPYPSIKSLYYMSRAKIRIDNVRNLKGVEKRKGQLLIQTWHGMIGFKCVEGEAESLLPQDYVDNAKADGAATDIMLTNNDIDTERYKSSFWYTGSVLKFGLPRLKPIIEQQTKPNNIVRRTLGIPLEKGVALFAPTFRDTDFSFVPELDEEQVILELKKRFGIDFVILRRLHPNIDRTSSYFDSESSKDASSWTDVQELLAEADVLITDYSSVAFDFMMGNKPVFLYAPDYESYKTQSRPFFLDIYDSPFLVSRSQEELLDQIKNFSENEMHMRYERFCASIGLNEDGCGGERIAAVIVNYCKFDNFDNDLQSCNNNR